MRYGGSLRLTGALSAKIENNTISLSGKYSMWMRHGTRNIELCHTHGWMIVYICMSHVTHMNASRYRLRYVWRYMYEGCWCPYRDAFNMYQCVWVSISCEYFMWMSRCSPANNTATHTICTKVYWIYISRHIQYESIFNKYQGILNICIKVYSTCIKVYSTCIKVYWIQYVSRYIDRGSSVIMNRSFARKLSNIYEFEHMWPLISDLDLEIWRQIS